MGNSLVPSATTISANQPIIPVQVCHCINEKPESAPDTRADMKLPESAITRSQRDAATTSRAGPFQWPLFTVSVS